MGVGWGAGWGWRVEAGGWTEARARGAAAGARRTTALPHKPCASPLSSAGRGSEAFSSGKYTGSSREAGGSGRAWLGLGLGIGIGLGLGIGSGLGSGVGLGLALTLTLTLTLT